jgi:hypothetical protein
MSPQCLMYFAFPISQDCGPSRHILKRLSPFSYGMTWSRNLHRNGTLNLCASVGKWSAASSHVPRNKPTGFYVRYTQHKERCEATLRYQRQIGEVCSQPWLGDNSCFLLRRSLVLISTLRSVVLVCHPDNCRNSVWHQAISVSLYTFSLQFSLIFAFSPVC